jgi:hypothetical protein
MKKKINLPLLENLTGLEDLSGLTKRDLPDLHIFTA